MVAISLNNQIVNAKNVEELPTMFGKGGMKCIFDFANHLVNPTPAVTVTNVNDL